MRSFRKIYSQLAYLLLFSGLGGLSYLLLIRDIIMAEGRPANISQLWMLIGCIFFFNVLGVFLLQVNSWLNKRSKFFFKKKSNLTLNYVIIAALLILLNYALLVFVKMMIDIPKPFMVRSEGWLVLIVIWLVELVIVSLVLVNLSFRHTLKLYRQTAMLQESNTKAQYVALQNQLNPHFLFNSLNVLISEIEYNPQSAIEFTRNLSDVYRYILQCQDQRLALLGDELEFLNAYIFLHQIRLGSCIILDNQLDKSLYDRKVPPLTLQLLAENVIKHNFISIGKPMKIRLSYSADDDMLVVSNELRPKKDEPKLGKGLQNLSSRYQLICGKSIVVEKNDTHFTVKTPLLYE